MFSFVLKYRANVSKIFCKTYRTILPFHGFLAFYLRENSRGTPTVVLNIYKYMKEIRKFVHGLKRPKELKEQAQTMDCFLVS
jgi:hypothetical protein